MNILGRLYLLFSLPVGGTSCLLMFPKPLLGHCCQTRVDMINFSTPICVKHQGIENLVSPPTLLQGFPSGSVDSNSSH